MEGQQDQITPVKANENGDFSPLSSNPKDGRNFAWRRWTARTIDFYFGFILVYTLFYALGYLSGLTGIGLGFWRWLIENPLVDVILTTILAYFSDVLVFAIFKTTLGKKLCGIAIRDTEGNAPSGLDYLFRDLRIFLIGDGLNLMITTLITRLWQYRRVAKGKEAYYDEGAKFRARPSRGRSGWDTFWLILAFALTYVLISRKM